MRHDAVPGVHRAPPGPKWESPLKAVLLASVAALALGGCATTQTAPTAETVEPATVAETPVAAPANILLADWSGPYARVPPFDKVTPEIFPDALQYAIHAPTRQVLLIDNNPAPPHFQNQAEGEETP